MTTRAPRGRAAVDAWPERLAAVKTDPTDENLQRLCNLLDAVDAWVVLGWDSHPKRREILAELRVDARRANRLVAEAGARSKAERTAKSRSARRGDRPERSGAES